MPGYAFLFPGQGAQTVGMGQQACDTAPAGRQLFDQASEILGYDLFALCTAGPADRLQSTAISQPAIYVCSLAALECLKKNDPAAVEKATATAGLSLGEYTALVFAGALSFADGLRVVAKRGQAMQAAADANPGTMISVLSVEKIRVEELVAAARGDDLLEIANFLCPGNLVVSGSRAACERLEAAVNEGGGRTIRLAVAGAFHTKMMRPADEALAEALASVEMNSPRMPVWSNVDAKPHTEPAEIRALLVRQVVQPVLFEDLLRGLLATECERFYEIGPGRVLAGLLKRVLRKADCVNIGC
ncbi:MAG TPA: ACP S-malonyltransferase [Gemmataceae bacterium]|jgi:[acyl-carrier-protein] S-malonyltransferase|nr:ACP S-malonyltransferase [Gemmataceae bacterium]